MMIRIRLLYNCAGFILSTELRAIFMKIIFTSLILYTVINYNREQLQIEAKGVSKGRLTTALFNSSGEWGNVSDSIDYGNLGDVASGRLSLPTVSTAGYSSPSVNVEGLFLDGNEELCDQELENRVTVIIPSSVDHFDKRITVRATWADVNTFETQYNYTFIFVVGQPKNSVQWKLVQAEQTLFGDLVVLRQTDFYFNLTRKILAALSWVQHYCPSSLFTYKVDDDVYLSLENMEARLKIFEHRGQGKYVYGGKCWKFPQVIRNNKSKFYVARSEFNEAHFPPYCEGPFYFMSSPIIKDIVTKCPQYLDSVFARFEDVFIGNCIYNDCPDIKVQYVTHSLMPFGVTYTYPSFDMIEKRGSFKWSPSQVVAVHSLSRRQLVATHSIIRDLAVSSINDYITRYLSHLRQKAFPKRNRQS